MTHRIVLCWLIRNNQSFFRRLAFAFLFFFFKMYLNRGHRSFDARKQTIQRIIIEVRSIVLDIDMVVFDGDLIRLKLSG